MNIYQMTDFTKVHIMIFMSIKECFREFSGIVILVRPQRVTTILTLNMAFPFLSLPEGEYYAGLGLRTKVMILNPSKVMVRVRVVGEKKDNTI